MTWLKDFARDNPHTVSGEEHRLQWEKAHWQQQQLDLMAAQRLSLEYSPDQLERLIVLIGTSTSPYKEQLKRQYLMALEIKRRGKP